MGHRNLRKKMKCKINGSHEKVYTTCKVHTTLVLQMK
jgi:hypothetical protein